jgi:hypothetical protein
LSTVQSLPTDRSGQNRHRADGVLLLGLSFRLDHLVRVLLLDLLVRDLVHLDQRTQQRRQTESVLDEL